jgi:arylsulfatase A-like enzyme
MVSNKDLNDLPPFGKKLAKEIYQVSSGKNFNGTGFSEHKLVIENNQWEKGIQAYLATINFADKYLGKFLDALDKSKYADNTIVVLWGDHGWHLGEKEHWRKMALWEDSTRTPLIIYHPNKIKNNSIVDTPISFIDIYPTLIDMCGLPSKKDNIDGKSFFKLLKNPTQSWDKPVLMTFGEGNHAVRTIRWRYIQYYDGTNELYDHKNDPHEWINLSGNKKYVKIIEELKQHIPKNEKAQSISHNNLASELIKR